MRRMLFLIALLCLPPEVWGAIVENPPPPPTGETVYLSTFSGNQIIKAIDSSSPSVSVIYTNSSASPAFLPEDITVGPDNKIYVCDSIASRIWRVTTSGAVKIYDASIASAPNNPHGAEGPSFNSAGDLFFNTRNDEGTPIGIWKIAGAASIPDSGPFTPVQVFSNTFFGEGTTFDGNDNLLFVDSSDNRVLESSPPYSAEFVLIQNAIEPVLLSSPIGIAVNSQNDIFVANFGLGNINHFSPTGVFVNTYATFTSPDSPFFMQFDASGNLFVVTVQTPSADHGKLWRLPPPVAPAATATPVLVVDLNTVWNGGSNSIGLLSDRAVGLGLPGTTFTTALQPIAPGTTTNFTDGSIINQTVSIPLFSDMGGAAFMAVMFQQVAPTVFNSTRLPATSPNTWSGGTRVPAGTTITPIAGAGGNGMVMQNLCFDVNSIPIVPCNIAAPTGTKIELTSKYKTQSAQPNPLLAIATDGLNDWANITNLFIAADPTIGGGTIKLNSDEFIGNLPSPPACGPNDEDNGSGEVEDENGNNGGQFNDNECDNNQFLVHNDPNHNMTFTASTHGFPSFWNANQALTAGQGTANGKPVKYVLVQTGGLPGNYFYSLTLSDLSGVIYQRSGKLISGAINVRH